MTRSKSSSRNCIANGSTSDAGGSGSSPANHPELAQHPGGSEIWFDATDGVISELTAEPGDDVLRGGAGDDELYSFDGADVLNGAPFSSPLPSDLAIFQGPDFALVRSRKRPVFSGWRSVREKRGPGYPSDPEVSSNRGM